MSLLAIAWRYLWSRAFVTALTVAGVALGAALIASVLTLRRETENTFLDEAGVYDLVVGAKGSPLQLTLSSVYHLDAPTGNIPWARYEALRRDPRVERAIPVGLGDNYRGYRIVGLSPEFFGLVRPGLDTAEPEPLLEFAQGRAFDVPFEAVLGSEVARRTGMGLGATFVGTHGLVSLPGSEEHADHPYTVVGILAPSGTSSDRAIFTDLAAVWEVHRAEEELHRQLYGLDDEEAGAPAPEREDDGGYGFLAAWNAGESMPDGQGPLDPDVVANGEEVTAVLLQLRAAGMRFLLSEEIKNNTESMAAIPLLEMQRLYNSILGPMQLVLLAIAHVVVAVSALGILATLTQSAERRRRDVALLRILGAHPAEILALILLEALLVSLLGVALGWLLGHGAAAVVAANLRDTMGLAVRPWSTDAAEWIALSVVAAAGVLAGLLPALLAYRRSPVRDLAAD